jgi:hypothetical protein
VGSIPNHQLDGGQRLAPQHQLEHHGSACPLGYGKYVVKIPRAVRYLNQVPFMKEKYVNEHGLVKDIALVKSYVADKYVRDGKFEVKLVWWIENIEGDIWEEGGAIVRLPLKYAPNS